MAREQEKESTGARSRYVWDPQKLAWVETVEEPPQEEPAPETTRRRQVQAKTVVESPREDVVEEISMEPEPVEAVVEAGVLQYRGAWLRLAALIVDFIILSIIMVIIGQITDYPPWTGVIVGFVYFVGFWSWRGQTLGKMIIGAKIVKADGSPITFVNAILRYLFYLIPGFAPILFLITGISWFSRNITWITILAAIVGLVVIGFSRNKRGIHDLIASTCVINTRARVLRPETAARQLDTADTAAHPDTNKPGPDEQE